MTEKAMSKVRQLSKRVDTIVKTASEGQAKGKIVRTAHEIAVEEVRALRGRYFQSTHLAMAEVEEQGGLTPNVAQSEVEEDGEGDPCHMM
eukprot:CAMPEP_0196577088 /NCGR_PEP_ID=MMETSP1081-20130531/6218_1 /TAXON_ID=36882 /ORGANISM="Pyramimonas amylifera, Strain CCMP720" /LENGTH=89 /DNA_ID=CAMNT_0041895901 /DNA_START=53 /DNA_END=319 /DNA_ORIENTATION=+